jgi:hypothetical protein
MVLLGSELMRALKQRQSMSLQAFTIIEADVRVGVVIPKQVSVLQLNRNAIHLCKLRDSSVETGLVKMAKLSPCQDLSKEVFEKHDVLVIAAELKAEVPSNNWRRLGIAITANVLYESPYSGSACSGRLEETLKLRK